MRSCTITVKEVAVTGVELSETSVSLKVGEQKQLTATVKPGNATKKTVIWESTNTSVAKVSNNGVITAVAKGSCTIKAKSSSDSRYYAECVVSVYGDPGAGESEGVGFEDL